MKDQYIELADSAYRTWETRENAANWYGRVLSWNEGSDKYIPVICGHGGSMWLCAGCGQIIMASQREEKGHEPLAPDPELIKRMTPDGAQLKDPLPADWPGYEC